MNTVCRLGACIVFLIVCCHAAAAEKREAWQAYVAANGAPYGYRRTILTELPDGRLQFRVETKVLIDFLGQRQENVSTGEFVVANDLQPISFQKESQTLSGKTTAKGTVRDGELVVVLERGDHKQEKKIPIGPSTIFACCLETLLHRAEASTETVSFELIDEESWTTFAKQAKRRGTLQWEVNLLPMLGDCLITLGEDGVAARYDSQSPPATLVRTDATAADQIKHRVLAGRDLLMFPVGRSLPFLEKRASITVRLSWKEVPFKSLNLEDSRQRIVTTTSENGRQTAVLKLSAPAPRTEPTPLPTAGLQDPQFQPFLAETRYIKPAHPAIVAQAKGWTADAATADEAVQALCQKVFEHLQAGSQLLAETLSGPDVLEVKTGKCTEYTTLLASLTRSLGIPTRIALGERLVGGNWIGHMWCEVYLGEWTPVDATANEVGGSPALLKLTHSDTVLGTQAARFALSPTLEIVVEDVAPIEGAVGLKTGIVGSTYTHADFGCRLTAPQGWWLEDKSKDGPVLVQFHSPPEQEKTKPMIHFVAFSLPAPLPASLLVTARSARFTNMYTDYKVLQNEDLEVAGLSGRRFVFQRKPGKTEHGLMKTTEFIWTKGNSGFLLNLIAVEDDHDRLLPQFEQLLESFELAQLTDRRE